MNKKRGVSLLVLSITIVVMAILATTAIMSLEDTGVVETSKDAIKTSNKTTVQERLENLKNTYIVENFGNASVTSFVEFLLDEGEIEIVPAANEDGSYEVTTVSGYTAKIEQDGESNLIITIEK